MKHCENCNCKEEWVKIEKLGIEISSPIKINSEKDIKAPKGQRLLTYSEYAVAIEDGVIPFNEDWLEYCTWRGEMRAVWLSIYADWFNLGCDNNPIYDNVRAHGVRLCKDIKK